VATSQVQIDKALADMVSNISKFSNSIRTYYTIHEQFEGEQKRHMDIVAKRLDALAKFNKETDAENKEYLKQLYERRYIAEKEHAESEKKYRAERDAAKAAYENAKAQKEELEARRKAIEVSSAFAPGIKAQYEEQLKNQIEATNKAEEVFRRTEKAYGDFANELDNLNDKIKEKERELGKSDIGGDIKKGIGKMMDKAIAMGPEMLKSAAVNLYGMLQTEISTGIGMTFSQVWHTAALGMNPKEFTEAMAKYRGAALAAGGLNKTIAILDKTQGEYIDSMGTHTERTQFALMQMDTLRKSGIKPLASDTILLKDSFMGLRKMAGMTGVQFQEMMGEVTTDESSLQALRSTTSEAERRQMVLGIANRIKENVAMGMTIEQAKKVTLALQKMAGATPIERIKQAAKLRAFGAAMGVSGGEQAAQALIAGQRATKEQKDQLQQFLSTSSNALSQAATGSLGGEIFATSLADKLGLNQLIGPGSDFNTVLTQGLAKDMNAAKGSMGEVSGDIKKAVNVLDRIASELKNNWILLGILGGVLTIARLFDKGKFFDAIKGMGERFKKAPKVPSGASTAEKQIAQGAAEIEKGAGGASKLAKIASTGGKALKVLGPIGAVVGGVAEGYEDWESGKKEKAVGEGVGAAAGGIAGAEAGAALGTLIFPGVGTVIGGLLGGGIGAAIGAWGGGKAGEAVGGTLDETKQQEAQAAVANTADSTSKNVEQMDDNNDMMKLLVNNTTKNNDIMERMLVAMTMTDKEKSVLENIARLREGSRFASDYVSSPG